MDKILIIDDEKMLHLTINEIIETMLPGIKTINAYSGKEGIKLAQEEYPSLILLDLMLPIMNGYEICTHLKNNKRTRYIPIIMITGMQSNYQVKIKSLEAGADAFLTKPLSIPELIAQIKSMLRLSEAEHMLRKERDKLINVVEEKTIALDESKERWDIIINNTNDGIWDWNLKTQEAFYSNKWKEILGFAEEEIKSNIDSFFSLIHEEDRDSAERIFDEYTHNLTNKFQLEIRMRCKDDTYKWLSYRGDSIRDENDEIIRIIGTQSDITDKKILEQKLSKMAHYDILTGLPNRVLLEDRLKQSINRSSRSGTMTGLFYIDIDGFKSVNDTYGHGIGDILLQQISHRMLKLIRKVDTLSRVGGDEFIVVLADLKDISSTEIIAKRIIIEVGKEYLINECLIHVAASVGIALFPENAQNAENLITMADIAMYSAKEAGGNQLRYFNSEVNKMTKQAIQKKQLSEAIIEKKFSVLFQPQLSVIERKLFGIEAILHWDKKKTTVDTHEDFHFLAMGSDLNFQVAKLVFDTVVARILLWKKDNLEFPRVTLHLNSQQFYYMNLYNYIITALDENGLDGTYMKINVTENIIMQNLEMAVEILNKYASQGFHVGLDNFGIGYFSVQHTKFYALHTMKFNFPFVTKLVTISDKVNIAKSIVDFAHGLNMTVVADGIKNHADMLTLKNIGCDIAQGEHVHPAITPDSISELLLEYNNSNKGIIDPVTY